MDINIAKGIDLIQLFKDSFTMWLLLITSIACLGFIIERAVFFIMWRIDKPKVECWLNKVLERIMHGDIEQALSESKKFKHSVGRVVECGLQNTDMPEDDLSKVLNNVINKAQYKIEQNIGYIGTIASIAPLLGLLGTVAGIIRAFMDMSISGSGGASVVAFGVAVALVTTAIGIFIAVPSLVAYNYFVSASVNEVIWLEGLRDNLIISIKKIQARKK